MAAPYSVDFREKVIELYKTKGLTQQELADNLSISISSIKRYLKLDREKASLLPKTEGKGRPGKIDDKGYQVIEEIISTNPSITLRELSNVYFKKLKIKAGKSVLSRACKKLNTSKKKFSVYASERESDT